MHHIDYLRVDALALDGSCLSRRLDGQLEREVESLATTNHLTTNVALTSGIDIIRVSTTHHIVYICKLMPLGDGGGGCACVMLRGARSLSLGRLHLGSCGSILGGAAMRSVCAALCAFLLSCLCMSDIILG